MQKNISFSVAVSVFFYLTKMQRKKGGITQPRSLLIDCRIVHTAPSLNEAG